MGAMGAYKRAINKVANVYGRVKRGMSTVISDPRSHMDRRIILKAEDTFVKGETRRRFQTVPDAKITLKTSGKIAPAWSRIAMKHGLPHISSNSRAVIKRREGERRGTEKASGRIKRGLMTIFREQRTKDPRRTSERRTSWAKVGAHATSNAEPSIRQTAVIRNAGSAGKKPSASTQSRDKIGPNRRQKKRRKSD